MHAVTWRWIQKKCVHTCWVSVAWVCALNIAWAAPVLRCQFEVNAQTYQHDFTAVADPYKAESVDLGGRFRFKAVMLADAQRVSLINLYVFYQTRRQPMIMQHTKFVEPTPMRDPAPHALTGQVAVYSPFLGKELQYACALHEGTP
jgi:hypothetical protein